MSCSLACSSAATISLWFPSSFLQLLRKKMPLDWSQWKNLLQVWGTQQKKVVVAASVMLLLSFCSGTELPSVLFLLHFLIGSTMTSFGGFPPTNNCNYPKYKVGTCVLALPISPIASQGCKRNSVIQQGASALDLEPWLDRVPNSEDSLCNLAGRGSVAGRDVSQRVSPSTP